MPRTKGSGIKQILVTSDNSAFSPYTQSLQFTNEGKHLIGYKVEDNVGNVSAFKSYEFILDITGPEVTLINDKRAVKVGDTTYIGSNFSFALNAWRKYSGVKAVNYGFEHRGGSVYQNPFMPTSGTNGMTNECIKSALTAKTMSGTFHPTRIFHSSWT